MIQTRPYEVMTKNTPQREWIERRGILLWLAFFFIELGAGMFFVSSFFNNLWGLLIGWLICAVLGGGAHLLYLGHPFRFWRMLGDLTMRYLILRCGYYHPIVPSHAYSY